MVSFILVMILVFTVTACAKSTNSGDLSDNGGSGEWPTTLMGNLPKPDCTVVMVTEYDAKSMSGELIVVNYGDMTKEFAQSYIAQLETLGYVNGVSVSDELKIIFSGTSESTAAVNFDYDPATKTGNISYKPVPKP